MNKTLSTTWKAAGAGILLSATLGFVSSSYGSEKVVSVEKFELKILEPTIGGDEILAGNFAAAVTKIKTSSSLDSRYAKQTSLCAAYTAQGELAAAEAHCQRALRFSSLTTDGLLSSRWAYLAKRDRHAMALNNLGVWHALQGHTREAGRYFKAASDKSKRFLATTSRNTNALEQRVESEVPVTS